MADTASARFRRTRQDHAKETAEDYVEMILTLIESTGSARSKDIASGLGVSKVTVTQKLQRLAKDGLVTMQPYKPAELTAKGREVALHSRQRHETVRQFLIKLGVGTETAEADTEGIEHHVSPETLAAMRRFIEAG